MGVKLRRTDGYTGPFSIDSLIMLRPVSESGRICIKVFSDNAKTQIVGNLLQSDSYEGTKPLRPGGGRTWGVCLE